jgi:hypothetical protein
MADPLVKKALEIFPGAEVTKVSEAEAPIDPAPDELEEDPPIDPDDEEIAALREQWHEKRKQ